MEQEKIMVSFRTFKRYKESLDKLAAKDGVTVTQYLNTFILNQIRSDIMKEADAAAKHQIGLKYGLPRVLVAKWIAPGRGHDFVEKELEPLLGKEKAKECIHEWDNQLFINLETFYKEFGFEKSDGDFAEMIQAFTTENDR